MSSTSTTRGRSYIDLTHHEAMGGHTIRYHVAVADAALQQRLHSDPTIPLASRFIDLATAETAVNSAIQANLAAFNAWLGSPKAMEKFDYDLGTTIGYGFRMPLRPQIVRTSPLTKVRVIVRKLARATPEPFVVRTAFPIS